MTSELKALISVHDVMPETLEKVRDVLCRLRALGLPPVPLLVVPGKDWQPEALEQLRAWHREGHDLIAHGWRHRAANISGIYHRLHSWYISKDVAEHLCLNSREVVSLMVESMGWFREMGFPHPPYYVPPAWAPGPLKTGHIDPAILPQLPSHIEILKGFLCLRTGNIQPLPLVGFEADTFLRRTFVRQWNRVQIRRSGRTGLPVRIGLHPHDFDLGLAADLESILSLPTLTPVAFDRYLNSGAKK